VDSIPSRFRGPARRDAAAFYLSQLARGILAGELGIRRGHDTVSVETPDLIVLDIAVTQSRHANRVSVRVRWPRRRPAADGGRMPRVRGTEPRAGYAEFTTPSSERNATPADSGTDARDE
jgi:amphi-Trp domain-containing protein